eukprot:3086415-Pleurochrysis_carterae.AAC.2
MTAAEKRAAQWAAVSACPKCVPRRGRQRRRRHEEQRKRVDRPRRQRRAVRWRAGGAVANGYDAAAHGSTAGRRWSSPWEEARQLRNSRWTANHAQRR